jgi:hypothetical protein
MGGRLPHGSALIAGLFVVACGSDDAASPSTFTSSSPASTTEPPPLVDVLPTGACADEGTAQTVRLRGGLEACRHQDGGFAPAADNEWRCTCSSGEWRCEISRGGFGGGIPCP